ncbi:hypothetical protein Tco_0839642 [Tanacetum coccineum]|uniref:Uncharacterized protein n=1 Tax=Tanacetum coccineum TaxID=301880 RepID=A0ABQ5AR87_9ASTR
MNTLTLHQLLFLQFKKLACFQELIVLLIYSWVNSIDQDAHQQVDGTKESSIAQCIRDPSPLLDTPEVTSKQAMIELSWIDAMQEEIHEFKRLGVWELVSCPDNVFLIKLKWIYKVNTDELVGLMQLRSRGVSGPLAVCTSGKRTQFLGDKLVSGRKEQKEHWHIEYRGDLTFLIDSLAEKALSRETLKRLAEETDE